MKKNPGTAQSIYLRIFEYYAISENFADTLWQTVLSEKLAKITQFLLTQLTLQSSAT